MAKKGVAQTHADELGHRIQYIDAADAYFCAICDKWLERTCSDSDCHYCEDRDEKLYKHLQQCV